MNAPELLAIVVVGLVAGFVNTVAGGGSFLTLPALIFLGLPPSVANGTNRVGVLLQSLGALSSFFRAGVLHVRLAARLGIVVALGAALGARLSLGLSESTLQRVVAVCLILLMGTIFVDPRRWRGGAPPQWRGHAMVRMLVFFGIGVYGGFLQAGVGLFLVAALVLLEGMDLVAATALKVVLVLVLTLPALAVFIAAGRVQWVPAMALSLGSTLGGWLGARAAAHGGAQMLRYAIAAAMGLCAIALIRGAL